MITFKEQFDKLTRAYIGDKVNPYKECACFIGNLLGGNRWGTIRAYRPFGCSVLYDDKLTDEVREAIGMYQPHEIVQMENLFLRTFEQGTGGFRVFPALGVSLHPSYEDALFEAFSKTLDLLKEIHESRGEKVDDFVFNQRKLEQV